MLNYDRRELERICRARGLRRVELFGSRVREDARPDSDVDLLVEYDPARAMTMFQFMDLEDELAALFPGLKVDVVSRNGLSPYLRDSILSEARVLYER